MKLRQTHSTSIVGGVLITALLSTSAAWAKTVHVQKIPAKAAHSAPSQAAIAARHGAGAGAGASLAAAGALGAGVLMMAGGSHSGQAASGPGIPSAQNVPSPVTLVSASARPVPSRAHPYVTLQSSALVMTAPLHRRVTTTSAVIPTPYSSTETVLQVNRVDRIINRTEDIAQGILPAHAVDRGIMPDGNGVTPGSTPEPAPGLILLSGMAAVAAFVLVRKRRAAF